MSSREPQITCDSCGNDLTYTSNCIDYRLSLVNVSLGSRGAGAVTSMMVYPAIPQDADFCGINCLREWLDKRYPADKKYHGGKAWAEHMRQERSKTSD